jgi:thiopurine S-methyltransferase
MNKDFWLERWEREEIGFHEGVVNSYLIRFWSEMHVAKDSKVFVPLCGKSVDMQWLRQQGHSVVGVELSEIAAQAFYRENGYTPTLSVSEKFKQYEANELRILCGDFFDLKREDLAGVHAVYDRASMVALPPDMRQRYAQHLVSILPAATQILLITFDYPQDEMPGPPFALSSAEVEMLFSKYADIRVLAQIDALPQNPRFQQRGLTRLRENIYLLTLNGRRD